jgi:2-C-methyl-D-erythritol 4-phosphate cytidylyltransferase
MGKNVAIILAAGKGKRMGANINKQFLTIKDKPILYYTLKAFSQCEKIAEIIIVSAEDEISYCQRDIVEKYGFTKVKAVIKGGKERQHSVLNGLRTIANCDIVLIHDGARPFINNRIIENGIEYAKLYKAAACGVSPKDTIKMKDKFNFSTETLNRDELFIVQTPQCFDYKLIRSCHENVNKEDISVTDDTSVVERYNSKVYLYEGSYNNIKITTPEDLVIGEKILDQYNNFYAEEL